MKYEINSELMEFYFKITVLTGILCNFSLVALALFFPNFVIGLFGVDPAYPDIWVRFSAVLLGLLTIYYVPGALDPLQNLYSALMSVICRFAGVLFFSFTVFVLQYSHEFLLFGLYDLIFGLPAAIFLALAYKGR